VPLQIGSADAQSGLTKEIFTSMDTLLSPSFQAAIDAATGDAKKVPQKTLDDARAGWKVVAFAVNLEIHDVQVTGDVNAQVVNGVAAQAGLTSTQANSGPGLVR
jgi:hypothetical protein